MDRSDLANRMKEYEKRNRFYLQKRIPVICRLDIRAGHSFTKGFVRPFDELFVKTMQETAKYLCENVMNCKLAYTQSDEISLLLIDYEKLETEVFFDYRVDKLCSILASMATMAFNKYFTKNVENFVQDCATDYETQGLCGEGTVECELCKTYQKAVEKGATFDCRAFNIPKEEVTNNFYWRQLDATRNSIQMVGQANFSHKELMNKTCNDIQDMLMIQKGINWNDLPTYLKRGNCCIKTESKTTCAEVINDEVRTWTADRPHWVIDTNIPIFKGEGRKYIDRLVMVGE